VLTHRQPEATNHSFRLARMRRKRAY